MATVCSQRLCNWPSCLDPEASARLARDCEEMLMGLAELTEPDLTDYRELHGCVEPPYDPNTEEPPW